MSEVPEKLLKVLIAKEAQRIARHKMIKSIYENDQKLGYYTAKEIIVGCLQIIEKDETIMQEAERRVRLDIG